MRCVRMRPFPLLPTGYTAFIDNTLVAVLEFLKLDRLLLLAQPRLEDAYARLFGECLKTSSSL